MLLKLHCFRTTLIIGRNKGELSGLLTRLNSALSTTKIQTNDLLSHYLLPLLSTPALHEHSPSSNQCDQSIEANRQYSRDHTDSGVFLGLYRLWPYDLIGIVLWSSITINEATCRIQVKPIF